MRSARVMLSASYRISHFSRSHLYGNKSKPTQIHIVICTRSQQRHCFRSIVGPRIVVYGQHVVGSLSMCASEVSVYRSLINYELQVSYWEKRGETKDLRLFSLEPPGR